MATYFPTIVLLLGVIVTIFTVKFPAYRQLTLISGGALSCVVVMIKPDFWPLGLGLLIVTYFVEGWKLYRNKEQRKIIRRELPQSLE
ncbi:hypothetical protein [Brevibacillus parabrevis]|uniref:hypothetical protein n=1 Tax=Brevibacillus parabrevis TaxID=54914 RepID=UPI0028D0B62C|nr:hypothetical protein [Brevibacillus parabrevis]